MKPLCSAASCSAPIIKNKDGMELYGWGMELKLPCLKCGQPAALDVTVISTMQQAMVNGAASTQGDALLVGEASKMSAHEAACAASGVTFVPIVMETLGGMSALTVDIHVSLGCLLGQWLGVNTSDSV